ncbi:MAG: type II toxin-antitoxin system MazE family antitoxin [Chroococcales cyanobacterium]
MSKKVSITLDDEVLKFVDTMAPGHNRSRFINDILLQEKQNRLSRELADAYREQSNDPEFQQEVLAWDVTVSDGLNA